MYEIKIVFMDGEVADITTTDWHLPPNSSTLRVQIDREEWQYFPLVNIKSWNSKRR